MRSLASYDYPAITHNYSRRARKLTSKARKLASKSLKSALVGSALFVVWVVVLGGLYVADALLVAADQTLSGGHHS